MCGNVRGNVNFRGDVPLTHIGNPEWLNVPKTRLRLYICVFYLIYIITNFYIFTCISETWRSARRQKKWCMKLYILHTGRQAVSQAVIDSQTVKYE